MTLPLARRAAVAAALLALSVQACSDPEPAPTTGASGGTATGGGTGGSDTGAPAGGSTDGPADPSPTSSGGSGPSGTAVPIYWAGDGPGGQVRLFREFQRVPGDPLNDAARIVAGGGDPVDPDYRTLWPGVGLTVTGDDEEVVVEVEGDAYTERPDGMSSRDARLAIQQLVYTLQGVQQARVPVRVVRDGGATRLFGVDTAVPFEAASALDTLNLVSITSPTEGDTVTGDTLTVTGVANSFEASGPCRLLQDGDEVALDAYEAIGWAEDRLFPFVAALPLDGISGQVVLRCETDDPSGGAEGDGPAVDTKALTIR